MARWLLSGGFWGGGLLNGYPFALLAETSKIFIITFVPRTKALIGL